jgi:hypothetical protein
VFDDGKICYRKQAARSKFETSKGAILVAILSQTFANSLGILFRFRNEAELTGAAQ